MAVISPFISCSTRVAWKEVYVTSPKLRKVRQLKGQGKQYAISQKNEHVRLLLFLPAKTGNQSMIRAEMLTASRLTSTSTAAAIATPESPHAIPSPEVAAGGTRAIAIATLQSRP